VSLGLSWAEPGAEDPVSMLIEAADEGLYSAKGAGRDRYSETVDLAAIRSLMTNS